MRVMLSGFFYGKPLFYGVCFLIVEFWSVMSFAVPKHISLVASCSRFEVKLPANPSTGFRWTLESYDTEHFIYLETDDVPAATTRMGAPGTRIFYFKQKDKTTCPESTSLRFVYSRAWEVDSSSSTEVTVKFN